jgi:SAM-dependent methyltransferase
LVESCQLLTRGRTGHYRCNPAHGKRSRALVGDNATAATGKGTGSGSDHFPYRASALRAYDERQSSRRQDKETQMAATAVEAGDERWATPEGRDDWLVPHPAVAVLVPVLKARGAQHVLDLGCGVGRHALLFAEHGFTVEAIDGAAAGLDFARREAGRNFGHSHTPWTISTTLAVPLSPAV